MPVPLHVLVVEDCVDDAELILAALVAAATIR